MFQDVKHCFNSIAEASRGTKIGKDIGASATWAVLVKVNRTAAVSNFDLKDLQILPRRFGLPIGLERDLPRLDHNCSTTVISKAKLRQIAVGAKMVEVVQSKNGDDQSIVIFEK